MPLSFWDDDDDPAVQPPDGAPEPSQASVQRFTLSSGVSSRNILEATGMTVIGDQSLVPSGVELQALSAQPVRVGDVVRVSSEGGRQGTVVWCEGCDRGGVKVEWKDNGHFSAALAMDEVTLVEEGDASLPLSALNRGASQRSILSARHRSSAPLMPHVESYHDSDPAMFSTDDLGASGSGASSLPLAGWDRPAASLSRNSDGLSSSRRSIGKLASIRSFGRSASTKSMSIGKNMTKFVKIFSMPNERRYSDSSAGRSFDEDEEQDIFTLIDIESSWVLLLLRAYHVWMFFLASIMIIVWWLNLMMSIFLEFHTHTNLARGITFFQWTQMSALLLKANVWSTYTAQVIQCCAWLLVDSLELDMFRTYRRSLCGEGPGPGSFTKHRRRITMATDGDKRNVYRSLSRWCVTERSIKIGGVVIPKGAQLLGVDAMWERDSPDDVLDMDLPALLAFLVDARPSGNFDFRCFNLTAPTVDIALQAIIFATLDIFPLAYSTNLGVYTVSASMYAVAHAIFYQLWVVMLDYRKKAMTASRLSKDVGATLFGRVIVEPERKSRRHRLSTVARKSSMGASPWARISAKISESDGDAVQRVESTNLRMPKRPRAESAAQDSAMKEHLQVELGVIANKSWVRSEEVEEYPNICVWIRNLLVARRSQHVMLTVSLGACALGLLLVLGFGQAFGAAILVLSAALLALVLRYRWAGAGQLLTSQLEENLELEANQVWALWFRMHCGISPMDFFISESYTFVLGLLLMVTGIFVPDLNVLVPVSAALCLWSGVAMAAATCLPNILWRLVLGETLILFVITVTAEAAVNGFYHMSVLIVLFVVSEAGLWRHRGGRTFTVISAFFTTITALLAALTFITAFNEDGGRFAPIRPAWCPSGSEETCNEFVFPLDGTQPSLSWCGFSWPLGPNASSGPGALLPGTVSDRCNDTALTVADFGHFARLPYHIPDEGLMNTAMERYLPGWETVYWQSYTSLTDSRTNTTTFMHLRRGTTSVITVGGTYSMFEALQDMNFWMPAVFLQVAVTVGPGIINMRETALFFSSLSARFSFFKPRSNQSQDLLRYVSELKNLKKSNFSELVYLTGHSLGGGLAAINGGLLDIPSITFSAPGLLTTSVIVQPSPPLKNMREMSVNVKPVRDPVGWADEQVGTVLPLHCRSNSAWTGACHLLDSTLCEILASCGDGAGRGVPRGYVRSCDVCAASMQSLDMEICNPDGIGYDIDNEKPSRRATFMEV